MSILFYLSKFFPIFHYWKKKVGFFVFYLKCVSRLLIFFFLSFKYTVSVIIMIGILLGEGLWPNGPLAMCTDNGLSLPYIWWRWGPKEEPYSFFLSGFEITCIPTTNQTRDLLHSEVRSETSMVDLSSCHLYPMWSTTVLLRNRMQWECKNSLYFLSSLFLFCILPDRSIELPLTYTNSHAILTAKQKNFGAI